MTKAALQSGFNKSCSNSITTTLVARILDSTIRCVGSTSTIVVIVPHQPLWDCSSKRAPSYSIPYVWCN